MCCPEVEQLTEMNGLKTMKNELTEEEMLERLNAVEIEKDKAFDVAYQALCREHKRVVQAVYVHADGGAPNFEYRIARVNKT